MPNRQISLQCLFSEFPCNAQAQNIFSTSPQNIFIISNYQLSLQYPIVEYEIFIRRISSMIIYRISLYDHLINIPLRPTCRISLQYPFIENPQYLFVEYPYNAQPPDILAISNLRISPIFQKILYLLSNKSFRKIFEIDKSF